MLLCLSSGTDLKKRRHVLKSLSLCNKVLSYLISLGREPLLSLSVPLFSLFLPLLSLCLYSLSLSLPLLSLSLSLPLLSLSLSLSQSKSVCRPLSVAPPPPSRDIRVASPSGQSTSSSSSFIHPPLCVLM